MCVEKESVLPLSSNPLFTAVPVMDGRLPLKDCVLSVSQFTGAERESLVELAKHLGAKYDYIELAKYMQMFLELNIFLSPIHFTIPSSLPIVKSSSFIPSLLQCPGLLCAPGQSEERHAGQLPPSAADP